MVHTVHPVWGNRSCLRFGIYSEALDDEQSNNAQAKNKRLRYGVVAGMVLVTTLLVGLMVYDMVGGHGMPTREKDAVQHLLMLRRTTEPTPLKQATIASTYGTTSKTSTTTSHNTSTSEVETATTETTTSSVENNTLLTEPHTVPTDYRYQNASLQSHLVDEAESSEEISQALPYRYTSLPGESRSTQDISNRKYGRTIEPYLFVSDRSQNISPARKKEVHSPGKENFPVYWLPPSILRTEPVIESRIMNHVTHQTPRPFRARNFTSERPGHNRIKIFKNDHHIALPYYGFSSPTKYPQLSSYRYPNEAKNIQDIIKYLTNDDSRKASASNNQEETVAYRSPASSSRRIKFAGVYKTANKEDSVENYNRPEESMEDIIISDHQNKMSDSSLNGHAYIADPFHAFKPSDPSEINLLANSDFRFAPIDNRIRFTTNRPYGNRWGILEINPNDKYFPRPPIHFGKPIASPSSHNENHQSIIQMYPGTYTSAIYRPFGKESTPTPSSSTKSGKKTKPFSVMLDIYPMMEDSIPQATSGPNKHLSPRPAIRPGHGFGHHVKFPLSDHHVRLPDQMKDSDTKHQMIVHLNLYPKKKTNGFNNRNDDVHSFHVDVKSPTYCCDDRSIEKLRRIYNEDEGDEEEELKIEYKSENNKKDEYTEKAPWKLSEITHKEENINFIQPRGVISGDSSSESEVSIEEVEDSQEQPTLFEIAPGTASSQHLRNHRLDKDSYTPLDIRLVPTTNTTTDISETNDEFSGRNRNGNVPDMYNENEQLNFETTPFLIESET